MEDFHVADSNILCNEQFLAKAKEVARDLIEWALGPGPSEEPRVPYLEIRSRKKKEIPFLDIDQVKNLGDKQ